MTSPRTQPVLLTRWSVLKLTFSPDVVIDLCLLTTASVLGARFRGADSCLLADANGNLDPEAPPQGNYGRRRSRAVLYQLSGHYKQDKIKTKMKLNNVSLDINHRYTRCMNWILKYDLLDAQLYWKIFIFKKMSFNITSSSSI